MGHLARFGAGVWLVTVSGVAAAQATPTGTFPQAPGAAAATASTPPPAPPLPPPPPAPALSAPPAPAGAPAPAASAPPPPGSSPTPALAPYPYTGYPPPGYAYYPPTLQPHAGPRLPSNAAVDASPFVDGLVTSVSWQNRVSQFLDVGLQAGVYVAGRVRLTANVLLPTSALTDDYGPAYPYAQYSSSGAYYVSARSKAASVFFGFGAGIVAVSTPTFVMAPGLAFSHTNVSDYGSSLAGAFPFEWVTESGLRLGFEFDGGRAFGGSSHLQCFANGVPANGCASSSQLTVDRPAGTSIVLQFQVGFGFNHPDPVLPKGRDNDVYGWPAAPAAVPAQPAPSVAPALPPS